jgi:IS5 family transposase
LIVWAEIVQWQYFSGDKSSEPPPPCDATQIGRFRTAIGEAASRSRSRQRLTRRQQLRRNEFERVIVDSTVQKKATAFPTDSRLLEIARHKVMTAAEFAGIALKQTVAREGKTLRRRAGGYAHARQYKHLRRVLKRQRTVLSLVPRDVQRKIATATTESDATEVASLLRVSPRTVQNYISSGVLPPPAKLGRRLLWLRVDIEFAVGSTFHSRVPSPTATKPRLGRPRKC